jgi:hypothetical protein
MIFCPFFTDKHAEMVESDYEETLLIETVERQPLHKLKITSKVFWYVGLVLLSIAVNSVIINLVKRLKHRNWSRKVGSIRFFFFCI